MRSTAINIERIKNKFKVITETLNLKGKITIKKFVPASLVEDYING